MKLRSLLASVALCILAGVLSAPASVQKFPDKPIRIVVPYAVGGANDQIARLLGAQLQNDLGQPVVIESRPGAGGVIGIGSVTKAAPDGYTLVIGETGSIAISPNMVKPKPYDSLKDLVPVAALIELPLVIAAGEKTGIRNLKDLASYGNGKAIHYGSAGAGTLQHLSMELLKREMKLDMEHVAYRGGAPALTDLIGGQIPLLPLTASTAAPAVQAGQIRPIAALGRTRNTTFPDLPTAAEQGYPSVDVAAWVGIFAPAGTPPDVVELLNAAIQKALARPEMQKSIAAMQASLLDLNRADFSRLIETDSKRWAGILKDINLSNQQ